MTPARIPIPRGIAPEADKKKRAKATVNALALPTALLSWTGRSAVGTTKRLFVLFAIPDDLDGQVLAPRALKGAFIVTGRFRLQMSHISVSQSSQHR